MVFHWNLSDNRYFQVSRTLLIILANFRNAFVWIVSTSPQIFKSSSPFTNQIGIVQSAGTSTGITSTFMFDSFFCSLARSRYLSLFSPSLILLWGLPERESPQFDRFPSFFFFFFFCWLSLNLVVRSILRVLLVYLKSLLKFGHLILPEEFWIVHKTFIHMIKTSFQISYRWWSLNGVKITATLLKSRWIFSIFWLILNLL